MLNLILNLEDLKIILKNISTLFTRKGYINFVAICQKTAPSQGYTLCKYIIWVGMHGKIDDKNNYRKHVHVFK